MLTLGIETSCDDTSIALLENETSLLANVVSSQVVHAAYGGVVPELASRAHVSNILPIFERALAEARVDPERIDIIGVTHAPGLAGSLLVGGAFAQGLALALDRPIVPVHHLEAHIVAILLERPELELPALALVVSGGHTLLVHVREWRMYEVVGRTRDDAAGEAFDKVAKLLGLGFPGGPAIEREARAGNPRSIEFPRPMLTSGDHDFSFSGLKPRSSSGPRAATRPRSPPAAGRVRRVSSRGRRGARREDRAGGRGARGSDGDPGRRRGVQRRAQGGDAGAVRRGARRVAGAGPVHGQRRDDRAHGGAPALPGRASRRVRHPREPAVSRSGPSRAAQRAPFRGGFPIEGVGDSTLRPRRTVAQRGDSGRGAAIAWRRVDKRLAML